MTPEDLKRIVSGGESETLEFKIKVNHPEKIIREIAAFANAKGGTLLIGVDDDKNIIGVKGPVEEIEVLNKSLRDLVRPEIQFETSLIPISRKRKVVCYQIKESPNKPHFVNQFKESRKGSVYYRYLDKTIQASSELVEVIRKKKKYKKGFMLKYGLNEEQVLKSIDKNGNMTINQIQELTGIERPHLSSTLVKLVVTNILDIEPRDGEDLYLSKEHANHQ